MSRSKDFAVMTCCVLIGAMLASAAAVTADKGSTEVVVRDLPIEPALPCCERFVTPLVAENICSGCQHDPIEPGCICNGGACPDLGAKRQCRKENKLEYGGTNTFNDPILEVPCYTVKECTTENGQACSGSNACGWFTTGSSFDKSDVNSLNTGDCASCGE